MGINSKSSIQLTSLHTTPKLQTTIGNDYIYSLLSSTADRLTTLLLLQL